jgi:hypothetical protein
LTLSHLLSFAPPFLSVPTMENRSTVRQNTDPEVWQRTAWLPPVLGSVGKLSNFPKHQMLELKTEKLLCRGDDKEPSMWSTVPRAWQEGSG